MKKIIFALTVFALLVASCNLDERPKGVLDKDGSIVSVEDVEGWAAYEYVYYRAYTAGSYVYIPEIAADFWNPMIDYGNRNGAYYRWDWNSGDPFVDIWGGAYSGINHACFAIEQVENMDKSEFDAEQLQRINKCLGVFYFTKAYFGLKLLNYYCQPYNANTKNGYGIMLVDLNRPSGDITSYPGRSTLEESYQWVIANAKKAESYLAPYPGEVGADELTIDAVHAFQARLALEMQDWNTAIALSTALVDGGKYPLCETQAEMTALWTNDSGKECIMQLWADNAASSTPSSNDPGYVGYNPSNGQYRPDWILNKWAAKGLWSEGDLRFSTWFKTGMKITCSLGSASGMTIMDKFPGNASLAESATAHINKIKLFRIAEQYLIAAEAFANTNGDPLACSYLDKLLSKRVANHQPLSLTGEALMNFIKEERAREFIGEGFRWNDLKRWGKGMTARPDPQLKALIHTGGSNGPALNLAISASDHRWAGPIPIDELAANPQIRDQQNPGY